MLAINASMEGLLADAATTVNTGEVYVVEDRRFQKLILIVMTPAMEDVAVECAVHRMALSLRRSILTSTLFHIVQKSDI